MFDPKECALAADALRCVVLTSPFYFSCVWLAEVFLFCVVRFTSLLLLVGFLNERSWAGPGVSVWWALSFPDLYFFSSILPPSEMSACYGSIACMALYLERGTGEFH